MKKSSKQHLNIEIGRHKESLQKLEEAMRTIDQLKAVIRDKDKQIHHGNIYSHRRLPSSRLGSNYRTKTLSSASSMISLAPIISEDEFGATNTQSIKDCHDEAEEPDDFNFDTSKTTGRENLQEDLEEDEKKIDEELESTNVISQENGDEYDGFYDNNEHEETNDFNADENNDEEETERGENPVQDSTENEIPNGRPNSFMSKIKFFQVKYFDVACKEVKFNFFYS